MWVSQGMWHENYWLKQFSQWILCFADRASWYDWVNDQLDAQLRYIIRLLIIVLIQHLV